MNKTTIKKQLEMMDKIKSVLIPHEYKKIDDVRIQLLIKKRSKNDWLLDEMIKDMKCGGNIELCGNSIRINQ